MARPRSASPTDGPPWAWRFAVGLVVRFLRLFGWRVEATTPDPVPDRATPLVVVSNHTSNIDPFLVADTVWRELGHWIQPLGKAEAFEIPIVGRVGHAAGAIPVAREDDAGRQGAYDVAVERLAGGGTIYIAAEGTVTHDGNLLPLRHGAARLALQGGADVLVVTHLGAQRAFSPVTTWPHRNVVVTMAMDVLHPWPGEDESALTGRIAATMIDRLDELRAGHPQRDPEADWWPPYARPSRPTATGRENLERYRASMAEAVAGARERMAQFAEEHHVDERAAEARHRAAEAAAEARHRAAEAAAEARQRAREAAEHLAERAREKFDEVRHHEPSADEPAGGSTDDSTGGA